MDSTYHETVLIEEVIDSLHITKGATYIDATLGNGGHTIEILKLGGRVLGIDMDPEMISIAESRIKNLESRENFKAVQGNFKDIDIIAKENNWENVSGILLDLGVTNLHLKSLERGFSFENPEAILDMRLDPITQGVKAADLLNVLREDQLESMLATIMEPGGARWITKRVIERRSQELIKTVGDFLEICKDLKTGKVGLNEATLPFLALRIAVNSELDNLKIGLEKAFNLLDQNGKLAVITFHSKEEEIVTTFFKEKIRDDKSKVISLKPIVSSQKELEINRRARSAKLRILQKYAK
ncbi:MAG TPA: 16S rRNA (cytosine(1402)-N(4))-methyltransferase RsmH [Patescibacteria group bacterium]|nr:16S rRNA (cytosine(1402)-N(4))-methyltransferase RsmH [Patescibacteria group bacterium]